MYDTASQCNAILAGNKSSALAAAKSAAADLNDSYNQLAIRKLSGTVTSSRSDDRKRNDGLFSVAVESCIQS